MSAEQTSKEPSDRLPVRGVIFDLDGTLVVQELDFEAIRREMGLASATPLLEAMERMVDAELAQAEGILLRHEQRAALAAELNPGVCSFLEWLDARGVRRGLLSRNSRQSIATVLERCRLRFDCIVAREDAPVKPSPQGIWQICEAWQLSPAQVVMVGDY